MPASTLVAPPAWRRWPSSVPGRESSTGARSPPARLGARSPAAARGPRSSVQQCRRSRPQAALWSRGPRDRPGLRDPIVHAGSEQQGCSGPRAQTICPLCDKPPAEEPSSRIARERAGPGRPPSFATPCGPRVPIDGTGHRLPRSVREVAEQPARNVYEALLDPWPSAPPTTSISSCSARAPAGTRRPSARRSSACASPLSTRTRSAGRASIAAASRRRPCSRAAAFDDRLRHAKDFGSSAPVTRPSTTRRWPSGATRS